MTQDQIPGTSSIVPANGIALGADHVDILVDGVSQGLAAFPGWTDPVGAWSINLNLVAGTHTLTANAVHPSGLYTATASSTFTVAGTLGGAVANTFDADGNVTSRTWPSGLSQTLTWDAFGRLVQVSQLDSSGNGYNWSATYDGLGRRIQTTQQPVSSSAPSGAPTVTSSIYDPQVEFLEIGGAFNGAKAWKVYGPDLNGRFGDLQGTGGLEATILDSGGTTLGVINDQFGNGVASVSGSSVSWFATRVGAYGPLPGTQAATLTDITQLAAATAWRGRRIDPTGFYDLGARYYEPTSGRFLSADPLGHGTSPSLYDFCGGDPVNYFDPLGLGPLSLQQQLTQAQNISNQAALKIQQAGGSVPLSNGEVSSLAADATNTGTALYVAAHYSQPESTTGQLATTVYRSDVAANVAESAGDVLSVAGAAVTGYQIGKAINNGDSNGIELGTANAVTSVVTAAFGVTPPGAILAAGQFTINTTVVILEAVDKSEENESDIETFTHVFNQAQMKILQLNQEIDLERQNPLPPVTGKCPLSQ